MLALYLDLRHQHTHGSFCIHIRTTVLEEKLARGRGWHRIEIQIGIKDGFFALGRTGNDGSAGIRNERSTGKGQVGFRAHAVGQSHIVAILE